MEYITHLIDPKQPATGDGKIATSSQRLRVAGCETTSIISIIIHTIIAYKYLKLIGM